MAKQISPSMNQPYLGAMNYKQNFQSYKDVPFKNHYTEEFNQNAEKIKESFSEIHNFKPYIRTSITMNLYGFGLEKEIMIIIK